jgi:hypothetical protein
MRCIIVFVVFIAGLLFLTGCSEFWEEEVEESQQVVVQKSPAIELNENEFETCDSAEECSKLGDQLIERIRELYGDLLTDYSSQVHGKSMKEQELVIYELEGELLINPDFMDAEGSYKVYRDDLEKHRQIWEMFTYLIPKEEREMVSGYLIYTDGPAKTLAHVEPDRYDLNFWWLGVDIIDANQSMELKITLLHEFAHLFTLEISQMDMNEEVAYAEEDDEIHRIAEAACAYYFVEGMGCTKKDSYLHTFYTQFWLDIIDEWRDRNVAKDEDEAELFYYDYEERFVTDYATTSPEEDIAETWTYFVLSPYPQGTEIWEQKIRFFHQYPEQLKLRVAILSRLLAYLSITRLN